MLKQWLTFILIVSVALSAVAVDLPRTCAGQNLSRFMATGQPGDAPPDKIYKFTDIRNQVLQEVERSTPNACITDFYKQAVNEESNYWARAIQPDCTVTNAGEIRGTCSRKSEAVKSTRFVSSLDRELRGRLGDRLDAAEADEDDAAGRDPNCPLRRGPAAAPQQTAEQQKDYFCCGDRNVNGPIGDRQPSREQQGMVRLTVLPWNYPVREMLNYNECINKIRPRAVTAGTAASCVGYALQGAMKVIWDSISSIWKLPGVLWGLRTQIAALWRDRDPNPPYAGGYRAKFIKNIQDAITHFVTDKVNSIGTCLNNPERINLICRFAGEIVSTLVLPESLGMLFGLASKAVGAAGGVIAAGLRATGKGQKILNGLGRVANGTAAVGRYAAGKVGGAARATGRVVDRATFGGAGKVFRGGKWVVERTEALRQKVVVRPLSRLATRTISGMTSGVSFVSRFAAAARRERQFAGAARAAAEGEVLPPIRPQPRTGPLADSERGVTTIDGATGEVVDPATVTRASDMRTVGRSSTADRAAGDGGTGGRAVAVRDAEVTGGAAVPRAGEGPSGGTALTRTEPQAGAVVTRDAAAGRPAVAAPETVIPPERRLTGPAPAPAATRIADVESDIPTIPRGQPRVEIPPPRPQALLPAPTRVATNVESAVGRASPTVAATVASDTRVAAVAPKITGTASVEARGTQLASNPPSVSVNFSAPTNTGVRLGGGSSGGANVFTGGSSLGADAGVVARANVGSGSASKLNFIEGSTATGAPTAGAARAATVGRESSAGAGVARGAAVEEGSGAAVAGRPSSVAAKGEPPAGASPYAGSERPIYTRAEKAPVREGGAPTNAESSAFAERPANAKVSPEKVNRRLAVADRQALDELEIPSLKGEGAKFKPNSRFDDVESLKLKDKGARVSEVQETRIEVEDRLARLKPETREQVINHLKEIPADRAHLRDSNLAAILNSNDELATIERLKLASSGPAGRTEALNKLDVEINVRTRRLADPTLTREQKLAVARERSGLLFEQTLIDFGDNVRVRNIYSANTHNRFYDLQKGYEPHSLENTFNVDIEVTGKDIYVTRGSYATDSALATTEGGYYTKYREDGYLDRDVSRDVLASTADVTLPQSEQGISRFSSYEAQPGEQFSLGQNGPVRYDKEGEAIHGSGGDGGSVELFCSRSPNCIKFENISDSVVTPTCRRGTPACDQLFKIQEQVRFRAVTKKDNPAAVFAEQRARTQKIIRDMAPEHDRLVAELSKPDFDLIRARSEHPELVSAINLDREIALKTERLRTGGLGPRKLDADTHALYELEVGTNKTVAEIKLKTPSVDKDVKLTNAERVAKEGQVRSGLKDTIDRADAPVRLRQVDTRIRDAQARLRKATDVSERRNIAADLIRYSEERSDALLSFNRLEKAVNERIAGLNYLDESAKSALLEDVTAHIKSITEPRAPMLARAEKIEPVAPTNSVGGARAPPRVLDDAPSYSNEIELLAQRDGLGASRGLTDPQIEGYSRDLRITNGNMARDIEYKPISTKRELDGVVAKALPDANIDTDRLRRMMSYRPQSGYLTGADFAEARKFANAVEARGISSIDKLPLSKLERETLNRVMDRAPMYARQIDADVPKLGRLSTEAQVTTDTVGEAAAAAKKAEFDARVTRAEAALNKPAAVPEKAPSYANEIEVLAQRDGLSAGRLNEKQLEGYGADLRITNGNMIRDMEYKPITTRRDMQGLLEKVVPEGMRVDGERLRRMMSYRPQSGYLSGADFAEAKKFMQAVEARGGAAALDQMPFTPFERQNLNKIMDRAPMYARQGDPALSVKMGRLNADPAAVVMPAKKAEGFVADFRANGLNPKAATALTDADRIAVAERIKGRKLQVPEKEAVIKAHNIDCGGFSVNNPCNANKGIALRRAGFNPEETRDLMSMGVTGSEGPRTTSLLDDAIAATPEPRVRPIREPKPAAALSVDEAGLRVQKAEALYRDTLANPNSTIEARLNTRNQIGSAQRELAAAQQRDGSALLNDLINKPTSEAARVARGESSVLADSRAASTELRAQISPARNEKMMKAFEDSGTTPLNQSLEVSDIRPGQTVTYVDERGAVRTAKLSGPDPENPSNFRIETSGVAPKTVSLKQEDVALTPTEQSLMYKEESGRIQAKMDARTPEQAKADFDAVLRQTEANRKAKLARDEAAAKVDPETAQKAEVDRLVDGVVKKALANPNEAKIAELRLRAASEGVGTDQWRATLDEVEALERPYTAYPKETIDFYNRGLDEIPPTRVALSDSELSFVGDILERERGKLRYSAEESALFDRARKVLKYPAENAQKRINEISRVTSQNRIEIPRSVFDEVRKASPYDQQGLGKVEKLFKQSSRDADIGETSDLIFDAQRFNSTNFMKRKVAEGTEPYVSISRRIDLYVESKQLSGVIRKTDELAATAAARYQATVRKSQRAEDYMAAYRRNGLDETAATNLKDADRIAIAERVSRRSLNPAERDAVIKAHNIDCGGFSVNNPCNATKGLALRKAGFSQNETRNLMQMGVTGSSKTAKAAKAVKAVEMVAAESYGDFSVLPRGPKISGQSIGEAYRKRWPNAKPGARVRVDLPVAPYSGSSSTIKLSAAQTREVNAWAENVLAAAQAKYPGKKLKIKGVDVGIGFNARDSYIHADNAGTYMHASSTLEGGSSTVMFTDSARAKIDAFKKGLGPQYDQSRVFPYIKSINKDGSLTVLFREGGDDIKTMKLSKADYIEPEPGTTAIFSGTDHVRDTEGVQAALHASPLTDPKADKWDRVTFFVGIEPDTAVDVARGVAEIVPVRSTGVPAPRILTAAEKAAGKDQLIEEFGNVKLTTPEQNRAFIELRNSSTPDQIDRAFLVMDNTKLGEINNLTNNKLLANAITNKHIARVQESMAELAGSYTKTKIKLVSASEEAGAVEVMPYSSFKSGVYGFVTENGAKLPDEFMGLVSKRMIEMNNQYYAYLRDLEVLPQGVEPMFLFRSGLDRTYREAEQAARQARTSPDINRPRSMSEPQIREQTETSFAYAQLAQKIHTNRLQGTDLVTLDAQSGQWVFSAKGMDLIKKAKKPETLMTQIKQTTGVSITERQAALMIKHKDDTDIFIPSTLIVTRESPVLDSVHGGINFDLAGAGAEGSHQGQLALARSKNVDELFENAEKGEKAATEILNNRRAAVRAATEPVMDKYGVKGRFVESGDDMAFVAENKPVPQEALDEVVRNLGRTKEPSKVRMSAVGGDIASVETRMTIGTQGEAIEKSVRARLIGVLPDSLKDRLVLAVKMETKELGRGNARLMIGSDVQITPFQRQQIEKAFQQAATEYKYNPVVTSNLPVVVNPKTGTALVKAGSREIAPVDTARSTLPAVIEPGSAAKVYAQTQGRRSWPFFATSAALAVGSKRDIAASPAAASVTPTSQPAPGSVAMDAVRPLSTPTSRDTQLSSAKVVDAQAIGLSSSNNGQILRFADSTYGVWRPDEAGAASNDRSEVLAYEIDRKLGFNLVPSTVVRTIDGKIGLVQSWVPTSKEPSYTQATLDKQSTLDFIMDHGDRLGANYTPEVSRFLSTAEGKSTVDRLRTLVNDAGFRAQVTTYVGTAEAQKMMNRFKSLINTADRAPAAAAHP